MEKSEIPFFTFAEANAEIKDELDAAWRRVFASNYYILGPELEAFEAEFAAYCGAKYCIGVSDGLAALQLSLQALGIGAGDEVIVPAHTFIATWLAVTAVGATPVGVECDARDFNIDPKLIEAAVNPRTRAIMPVHLYGHPAAMHAINEIAAKHHLAVIEDSAQAHGATLNGRRTGGLGTLAGFSFYPTKNLGALGDGGAIVTGDAGLAARLKKLRNYGSQQKYKHEIAGTNSRLDELQAAFLRVKLRKLDAWNQQRRERAAAYSRLLEGVEGIQLPSISNAAEHVWHLFVIRVSEGRDALAQYLRERGIHAMVHYPCPPHLQGAYATIGGTAGAFPIAEKMANDVLSLPFWPHMPMSAVAQVADAVKAWRTA